MDFDWLPLGLDNEKARGEIFRHPLFVAVSFGSKPAQLRRSGSFGKLAEITNRITWADGR